MERYEKYKDSGIEWIGEIPEKWSLKRLKYLLRENITDGPHETPEFVSDGIPFLSVDSIKDGEIIFENTRKISEVEHCRFQQKCRIERNDILMGKAASVGKIARVKVDFEFSIWSPLALIKSKTEIITSEFLEYYLKSEYSQAEIILLSSFNTQRNISMADIPKLNIVLPPTNEQNLISLYLDKKLADLNKIIEIKGKLIALYEEEKQTIINQAVTKGLDPNVQLKDSGVEWLGEIPEHWEVKSLKYVVSKIGSGVTPTGGSNVYQISGIPLLRSQNIYFDGLKLEDVAYISEDIDANMSNSRINEKDVLLNITGGSIGRCYYVPDGFGVGNVNQHVCILRPILQKIDYIFLYFLLRSNIGQLQIDFQQTGANREGLNFEQLKNFFFPLMGLDEQHSIVAHIENECTRLDANIEKYNKQIDLLQEYRTTLISEVVTGKMKVDGIYK